MFSQTNQPSHSVKIQQQFPAAICWCPMLFALYPAIYKQVHRRHIQLDQALVDKEVLVQSERQLDLLWPELSGGQVVQGAMSGSPIKKYGKCHQFEALAVQYWYKPHHGSH